ncbi:MAG TPA: sugar ABC transporter ATP-binding protein [Candidatus Sulfotelmatobacter sp.]|jgi:inositol transport system ATP-binding protein|nr:sugar ABC transporter ATP-binding protein [Candidatus Sulfotelmatobacter sp.]
MNTPANPSLPDASPCVLRMTNIAKSYSGMAALSGVKLEVARGEVHALMGENGAGKSTLMKILSGLVPRDTGEIYLDEKLADLKSPKAALDLGISMIHQELNPVRAMTVAENIFLGKEPCYGFTNIVNRRKQRELTLELFREMDVTIAPDRKMSELSVAEMQLVEIVKAVSYQARIIIMDEPTSAITGREVAKLFTIIRGLKAKGIAIIYISHKMDEIFRIADTITVLRDGQYIDTKPAAELDHDALVKLMVGRKISELFPPVNPAKGEIAFEVQGLTKHGLFENISFKVRKGEVFGIAGLMGAGRTDVMETVFGLRRADAGCVKVDGREVKIHSPAAAIRHRMALITEDRAIKGLNLKASVRDNITLAGLKKFTRFGQVLNFQKENCAADGEIEKLRIKTRGRNQIVKTLSGGNQQKVVLARWLLNDPEIIILDEPTRGIDIGAKAEIYKIIAQLAGQGRTIIMVSSELEEILGLCDRVLVLYHGKISAEYERSAFNQEVILKAAMGNVKAAAN